MFVFVSRARAVRCIVAYPPAVVFGRLAFGWLSGSGLNLYYECVYARISREERDEKHA